MTKPCGDCCSIIYKSDGSAHKKVAGIGDFCDRGCVLVDNIRVPFPDCSLHGNPFTHKENMIQ